METCRAFQESASASRAFSRPQCRPRPQAMSRISVRSFTRADVAQTRQCRLATDLSCVRSAACSGEAEAPFRCTSRPLHRGASADITGTRSASRSLLHPGTSSRGECRGVLYPAVGIHRQPGMGRRSSRGTMRGPLLVTLASVSGSIAAASSAEAAASSAPPASGAAPQLVASEGVPLAYPQAPRTQVGPRDFAILSLCFVACAISAAFSVVLVAAVPALLALRRAAIAIEQLAITAREELPGTMAAVRLSGMEISDLTMELSDLSQEITEGVRTSTRAVKAAEDGIKRMKSYAQTKTVAMLEERAAVPSDPSVAPPRVAQVARQSKEAISGARSVVSQVSMLGSVLRYVPFVGKPEEKTRKAGKHERVGYL